MVMFCNGFEKYVAIQDSIISCDMINVAKDHCGIGGVGTNDVDKNTDFLLGSVSVFMTR